MSIRYCKCGHANHPARGILAKTCSACGTSLVSTSLSNLISQVQTSPAAPAPKPTVGAMTPRQQRVMNQRLEKASADVEFDEADGEESEEIDVDNITIAIRTDASKFEPMKLGNLVEAKKSRTILPERGRGTSSKEDIKKMRESLKSSKNNPHDIQ